MAAFRRPGETQKSAFGISFEADRDLAPAPPAFTQSQRLDLKEQKRRLPIAKVRWMLRPLVSKASLVLLNNIGPGANIYRC